MAEVAAPQFRSAVQAAARCGLKVKASPRFPRGEESGRVRSGVGTIVSVESEGLSGVCRVFWHDWGDYTTWTRVGALACFDLVAE